jgi:hypothetical protein
MSEIPVPPPGKIMTGAEGLGTPTPEMVEERARELARTDGRTEPHDGDRAAAKAELLGPTEPQTPEVTAEVENVTEWDEAPEVSGVQAPRVLPEDEANIAEVLVGEGLEEADHDVRVLAADENPPEEEEI